jgi:hypothetical protein
MTTSPVATYTTAGVSYEIVTPMDLRPGDVIIQHGGLFRVLTHTEHAADEYSATGLPYAVNMCVYIGRLVIDRVCDIPVSWRKDWNAQGNELARVPRVIPAANGCAYWFDV